MKMMKNKVDIARADAKSTQNVILSSSGMNISLSETCR